MPNRFPFYIAACLIFCSLEFLQAATRGDLSAWSTTDLTQAVELSAVYEDSSMWTVSFKNRSTEAITAVAVSFKADAHHYQDWLNAEPSSLAPGQTFDLTIAAEDGMNRKVKISAVIFEDGSSKGDETQVDIMQCHRFGNILESTRIKDILRNRRPSNDDAGINSLLQKLGTLPLSAEDAFISLVGISVPGIKVDSLRQSGEKSRNAVLWGVSTARERALHQMESIKQLPVTSENDATASRTTVLSVLQEQYDAQSKKAHALLLKMQGGR
jgi:hypothetical protein